MGGSWMGVKPELPLPLCAGLSLSVGKTGRGNHPFDSQNSQVRFQGQSAFRYLISPSTVPRRLLKVGDVLGIGFQRVTRSRPSTIFGPGSFSDMFRKGRERS